MSRGFRYAFFLRFPRVSPMENASGAFMPARLRQIVTFALREDETALTSLMSFWP
jgi:hypothetical protein